MVVKFVGGMAGADAAFVIAEHHIHDPVETVFHGPMAAYDGPKRSGLQLQRRNAEPGFAFDFAGGFALAFDHGQGLEAAPATLVWLPFSART